MTLRIVAELKKTEVPQCKIKLNRTPDNTESIIYAMSKRLENNPCKIASVKFPSGERVDVLVMNNLIVKNNKEKYVVDTSKRKINQKKTLSKFRKYFYSNEFK